MLFFLIERFGPFPGWLLSVFFGLVRYLLVAGAMFLIFYVLWNNRFRKIQPRFPKSSRIWHDIQHSVYTVLVIATLGLLFYGLRQAGLARIYLDIHEYGWQYLIISFFGLLAIHDTYFYWVHRLMHHPRLFRVFHKVHHISNNPTPWTFLSFHPLEAVVEFAFFPFLLLVMPLHPLTILAFALWATTFNVVGHLGYELFPGWFLDHPLLKWFNTSTHHNMHHARSNCNYGLYFNFWDWVMGTNAPDYKATFKRIQDQ